ncbi:MAG: hypothetical protein U5K43_04935 [Halofilum sp. (in: g-proteobacteria)]|nr:hypothetical protein [Halofilum sp. (in: g-proteobacteria)]
MDGGEGGPARWPARGLGRLYALDGGLPAWREAELPSRRRARARRRRRRADRRDRARRRACLQR